MHSIVKRKAPTQLSIVQRLFRPRKKVHPFGNPAREYQKINYDALRRDMLAVFLNPGRHAEMRQKWAESHPQNMMIRQALKHMAFERQDPKRKAEWASSPKSIREELVRSSIESQMCVVKSESEAIKTNGQYGRGVLESTASRMSRGTRKRLDREWAQEKKDTNKNVAVITRAIAGAAKRNKANAQRIREIGDVFINCARSGDANIALTGLRNTFARQITGEKGLNEKLLGGGGYVALSKLSTLSETEIRQVADFAAKLAESTAEEERTRKVHLTEQELMSTFNDQYLKFLVLRLQYGKDGVKTKGLLTA